MENQNSTTEINSDQHPRTPDRHEGFKQLRFSKSRLRTHAEKKKFDYAFEIKLFDPLQKPIAFKSRPFHLKVKVKQALTDEFDSKAGYDQIPVHPNSLDVTAFIFEFGLCKYLSLPMGISWATAWFQRFTNGVLRDFLIRDTLGVYLDDIILFSSSLEEHEDDVLAVIAKLKERNVKTSFEKSQLISEKIDFLGNIIER